jgi:histidinol-phosphate aminotransferase
VTSFSDLPIRDDLRGKSPYGAPQAPVPVALNVNENTHPIPDDVVADILGSIGEALKGANRYPDREFGELRTALAGYLGHGLDASNIWAANGSNEVLQQILQAFGGPGRSALGFAPTYSMYPLLASGTGTAWIAAERGADFVVTPDRAVNAVREHHPDVVMLCAPNNPTGTPLALDVVEAVYEATPGVVVVDEAYHEFMPEGAASALTLLSGRERLIVSRTMSKAFAFAGVRLGYLAAHPAVAALRHSDEMLATVHDIVAQRDRIAAGLSELGYDVHASGSNFVLFGGVRDPHATFLALKERGILVRDVGIPHHLRVSAGTEAETTVFLDAMARLGAV